MSGAILFEHPEDRLSAEPEHNQESLDHHIMQLITDCSTADPPVHMCVCMCVVCGCAQVIKLIEAIEKLKADVGCPATIKEAVGKTPEAEWFYMSTSECAGRRLLCRSQLLLLK